MKTLPLALLLLLALAGTAASAGSGPAGVGLVEYTEKVKVKGCGTFSLTSFIQFDLSGTGTWLADGGFGVVGGTLTPADSKGRTFDLQFDGPSFVAYDAYLSDVASELCGFAVDVTSFQFDVLQLKLSKDLSAIAFQIRSNIGANSPSGAVFPTHALKGKGGFAPN